MVVVGVRLRTEVAVLLFACENQIVGVCASEVARGEGYQEAMGISFLVDQA